MFTVSLGWYALVLGIVFLCLHQVAVAARSQRSLRMLRDCRYMCLNMIRPAPKTAKKTKGNASESVTHTVQDILNDPETDGLVERLEKELIFAERQRLVKDVKARATNEFMFRDLVHLYNVLEFGLSPEFDILEHGAISPWMKDVLTDDVWKRLKDDVDKKADEKIPERNLGGDKDSNSSSRSSSLNTTWMED